jgi:membrane protein DedA with SNARE-associated domain
VPLASITDTITSFIGDHGLYAVFVLMLVDAVFPAASEVVMLYAGALAAGAFAAQDVVLFGEEITTPVWGFVAMALAGTTGYTIGSVLGWGIGLCGGRPFLERRGRWFHLGPERLRRADRWFERWDDAAVFVGRITPVARSFISIPAGVFRMALPRYAALGSHWERLHDAFRYVEFVVVALFAAGVAYLVLRRRSSRLGRRAVHRQPE